MSEKKLKRVSDVCGETVDVDNLMKMDTILNKDIIIIGYNTGFGMFGAFMIIMFKSSSNSKKVNAATCGGSVVMSKLKRLKESNSFPVIAKIVKRQGKQAEYYDML